MPRSMASHEVERRFGSALGRKKKRQRFPAALNQNDWIRMMGSDDDALAWNGCGIHAIGTG